MQKQNDVKVKKTAIVISLSLLCSVLFSGGCNMFEGYSNQQMFPDQIDSVCLEMFDNQSFYRGVEYEFSDALSKRIEAGSPYKIISSKNRADSVISGYLTNVSSSSLTIERESGRALEKEVALTAVVNWKNLRTGEFLIEDKLVNASASYSEWQNQGFEYGSALAVNRLAERVVELMEKKW